MEPKFAEIEYNIKNAFRRITTSVSMLTLSIILIALAVMVTNYPARVLLVLVSLALWGIGSRKLYLSGKGLVTYLAIGDHATDMRIINEVDDLDKELDEFREKDVPNRYRERWIHPF